MKFMQPEGGSAAVRAFSDFFPSRKLVEGPGGVVSAAPVTTPEVTPAASAAPEAAAPAVETITLTKKEIDEMVAARVQAELAAARAERRGDVLRQNREARRVVMEKVKSASRGVLEEVDLLTTPLGREVVKDDIKAVGDEALRRANEVKNNAGAKVAEAWKWAADRVDAVAQTAEAGVGDLIEFTAAKIDEPILKEKLGWERFFGSLLARCQVRVEEVKIGIQEKIAGAGEFAGRAAGVALDMNDALHAHDFPVVEVVDRVALRLANESADQARAAAEKAGAYRAVRSQIIDTDGMEELAAYGQKIKAERRSAVAGRFPNFVSKLSRLFGNG